MQLKPGEVMPRIRIFEKQADRLHVWFVDEQEDGQRELRDPIGHLSGEVDWQATARSCRPLADEGIEIELVFRADGESG